jgi:hypothetical protein
MKRPKTGKLRITEFDAILLTKSRLLDIVLPNGKKLRDCTGTEVAEIAEALEEIGRRHMSSAAG